METIIAIALGIILLCIIAKIISLPMKLLWKLVTNSVVGAIVLYGLNFLGEIIMGEPVVTITFLKALIVGTLGVVGVVIVVIMAYLGITV